MEFASRTISPVPDNDKADISRYALTTIARISGRPLRPGGPLRSLTVSHSDSARIDPGPGSLKAQPAGL